MALSTSHSSRERLRLFARPDWFFLALGLIGGLLAVFLTPPMKPPDEISHFVRAYEVSEGKLISVQQGKFGGSITPESIIALHTEFGFPQACELNRTESPGEIVARLADPLDPQRAQFFKHNATFYFPTVYAPAALGMALTRSLGGSALVLMYAGRLATFVVALLATFFAIRATPVFKWTFAFLSLATMVTTQRASLSADSLTNAFALLLVALILRLAFDDKAKPTTKALLIVLAVSVFVAMSKQSYFLLPALFLMIPRARFGQSSPSRFGPAAFWIWFAVIVGAGLLGSLMWNRATAPFFENWDIFGDVRPGDQIVWIVTHPFNYGLVLLRTTLAGLGSWVAQVFGEFGFCHEAGIGAPLTWMSVAAFVGSVALDARENIVVTRWQRIVALGVGVATALLVVTALYLINPRGAYSVLGVVGRYFVPVIPVVCVAVYQRKLSLRLRAERFGWLLPALLIVTTLATLLAILDRYYF